jgi:predicted RNA-binding Zn-ribbon protein involved in translation (DUF1610 family)
MTAPPENLEPYCAACGAVYPGAVNGSNCPNCGEGIILTEAAADKLRQASVLQKQIDDIRSHARIASTVSLVCLVAFPICAMAAYTTEDKDKLLLPAAAGFLMLFLGFQILTQLLEIRARLLEK